MEKQGEVDHALAILKGFGDIRLKRFVYSRGPSEMAPFHPFPITDSLYGRS